MPENPPAASPSPQTSLSCAYVGQYHLGQFRRDLESILEAGLRRLWLPMTEEDLILRQENLTAMAAAAREAGLEVWFFPWGVGGVFSGPRGATFVARHLDARQIDSVGESLPAACPNNPRFAHFMETWLQAASDAGAQGILLDEPVWLRHPTLPDYRGMETAHLWTCRCEHCQRRFRSLYRSAEMPEELDEEVRDFRARTMGAFLRDVGESAWRRRMPSALRLSNYGALKTWELVASQPWCQEISLSAFWPQSAAAATEEWDFGPNDEPQEGQDARMVQFQRQMEAGFALLQRLRDLSQGARTLLWLRCFQVAEADEPLIPQVIDHLQAMGATNFAIWSFGGTEAIGHLACERPQEAWNATLRALSE